MRSRIARATPLAILVLGVAVATAHASTLTLVVDTFRATWSPVTFEASGGRVRCSLTLEGSFTSGTFAKTAGTRVGSVTRASAAGCSEGTVTVLTEGLPWSVQYTSFGGTLPNITSSTFRFVGAAFGVTPRGLTACLMRTSAEQPLGAIAERSTSLGELTGLRLDERSEIRLTGGFCMGNGHVSGAGRVTRAGATEGLVLLLGSTGLTLEGGTAEERGGAYGIAPLVIPAGSPSGGRGIRNNGSWYQIRLKTIEKIGGQQANFSITNEEANACRGEERPGANDGRVMRVNEPSCNIRVEVDGTARPRETEIEITYTYGFFTTNVIERFHVRAES